MTGRYGNRTGIRYLGDLLPPSERTIAHVFRDAGYRTSYVGKWHLSSQQNPYGHNEGAEYWVHPQLRGGFEDWAGFELSNHYWNTRYSSDETMWPPKLLKGYQTDALTDLALDYLLSRKSMSDEPWFHVLSLESPHHGSDQDNVSSVTVGSLVHSRYPAPPEYERRFRPQDIVLRANVPSDFHEVARSQQAQYAAMIANLDDNIGRLLDWLDHSPWEKNTIVAFFSDHGEMGGSHGLFQKCAPYAESLNVPLLVRLPPARRIGRKVTAPASLVDLLPTFASLCGIPLTTPTQGFDLSSLVYGEAQPLRRVAALSQWFGNPRYDSSVFGGLHWRAIRTERYTYWVDSNSDSWLFDNESDPMQLTNLSRDHSHFRLARTLQHLLVSEVLASGETVPEWLASVSIRMEQQN
jgi:arylsulfatase A-like enzyme